tara:strand:- start:44 stop:511 length:468 start_codon:yes stop_codon:yes gene_type:complete
MNKAVTKIKSLLKEAQDIAQDELGLENIFYNERFVELFMANELGHDYGNNTQGGDAYDSNKKKPVEYKAINTRSKGKGTFQFHWLSENKINQYSQTEDMYFCIRDGVDIKEIYRVPTKDIIPHLKKKSTGNKSIHGHWGTNVNKLINELNAEKIK